MTPHNVPEQFDRVMGCTAQELTAWLPVALPHAELAVDLSACRAEARFPDGALTLSWQVKPAHRIALLAIPQLDVTFRYVGPGDDRRREIQRRFDLATQRGGG